MKKQNQVRKTTTTKPAQSQAETLSTPVRTSTEAAQVSRWPVLDLESAINSAAAFIEVLADRVMHHFEEDCKKTGGQLASGIQTQKWQVIEQLRAAELANYRAAQSHHQAVPVQTVPFSISHFLDLEITVNEAVALLNVLANEIAQIQVAHRPNTHVDAGLIELVTKTEHRLILNYNEAYEEVQALLGRRPDRRPV